MKATHFVQELSKVENQAICSSRTYQLVIALVAIIIILTTASCETHLLPTSSGTPYDVIVVGDDNGYVKKNLEDAIPSLPQNEPTFNVTTIATDQFKGLLLLSRNIVKVSIDSSKYHRVAIKYRKNIYATPQIIVSVNAPSTAMLRQSRCIRAVEQLLTRHEINAAIANLQRKHNNKAEEKIKKMFDCEIKIPANMKINIINKDFIWLSNNTTTGVQNICIYASENRDSVMKANIKGETDGMHMTTTPHSTITVQAKEHGTPITIRHGLWHMIGDAMGGPYVSHTITDKRNGRTIVAEAFVYAPESKKSNPLRQAEAVLYTLRPTNFCNQQNKN